jgi:dipeptidyl-peptidase-3
MTGFKYQTEKFADIRILRYRVPGFENLSLKQKIFAYYLAEAALNGRDILWHQNYKHNIKVRNILENIFKTYSGDRQTDCFKKFTVYLKRIWFSNGLHHHYSTDKILPDFDFGCFEELIDKSDKKVFNDESGNTEELKDFFKNIIFNPETDKKRVNLAQGEDLVKTSAVNFYKNVSQKEVEEFYNSMPQEGDEPLSYGLNSKLVKKDGKITEEVYKVGGLYGKYISRIVENLKKALPYSENETQKQSLEKLIEYYETGDLKKFDEYNILWVSDTESEIDVINGFIEVYGDPLGRKATYESTVSMIDKEATKRAKAISENAEWFEKHSPTDVIYKKKEIKGVSAKAVDVIMEAGDCSPSTPIGINLPNADWIRTKYGSKSVTISNIIDAYDQVSKSSGAIEEFAFDEEEVKLSKEWGTLGSNLHVDMHEIIGHGSGKMAYGVGDTAETLKSYASTIEEARADLVALYFAMDQKLIDLGLMPNFNPGIAEYNSYIRSGLMTQLVRIEEGKDLEESHMRNRQLIAKWAYNLGRRMKVIEKVKKDGKTYFKINDYQQLRKIFGIQLREIQRIKSEGDYKQAEMLVEKYGVKVDKELHKEVLERWRKLNIPPYSGFINPQLELIENQGKITGVQIHYPEDFANQMLYYSNNYS